MATVNIAKKKWSHAQLFINDRKNYIVYFKSLSFKKK